MASANHCAPSPLQVTRPHPSDNPLLFIFMVGGVTASELRLIREVVASHRPGSQVSLFSLRCRLSPGLEREKKRKLCSPY